MVGTATLRQAFNIDFANELFDRISNDEELVQLLSLRFQQGGITVNEDVQVKKAIKSLIDAFEPIVPDFISSN